MDDKTTMELNIFEAKEEINEKEIIDNITKNLNKSKVKVKIIEKTIQFGLDIFKFTFFYGSKKNNNISFSWFNKMKEMLDIEDTMEKNIISGYGILLISGTIINDDETTRKIKYFLTFGLGRYAIKDLINYNFRFTNCIKNSKKRFYNNPIIKVFFI